MFINSFQQENRRLNPSNFYSSVCYVKKIIYICRKFVAYKRMKKLSIKNSTIQFLAFMSERGGDAIDIAFQNGDLWATQKAMATLFGVQVPALNTHIKNIFGEGELNPNPTVSKMEIVVNRGFRSKKGIPVTMQDWLKRLDKFLLAGDRDLLLNAGKISSKIAKDKAESEFEKFRVKQDQRYQRDFDRFIQLEEKTKELKNENENGRNRKQENC